MYKFDAFISFSSRDQKYIKQLMASLNYQGITFWDYSDELQSIKTGSDVINALYQSIDESQYFIAVISKHSMGWFSGKFTRKEMKYALEKGKREAQAIIPVMISNLRAKHFSGPYKTIKSDLYLDVDFQSHQKLENAVGEICKVMGKKYQPIIEAHPLMPFWQEFSEASLQIDFPNVKHIELMALLTLFNAEFKKEDWEKAHAYIESFIALYKLQKGNSHGNDLGLFYPYIVKAVCEHNMEKFDDALISYKEAGKIRKDHHYVYAGIGGIYNDLDLADKAIQYAELTYKYCKDDDKLDELVNLAAVWINYQYDDMPENLKQEILSLDANDKGKPDRNNQIRLLQSLLYYYRKDYPQSLAKISQMDKDALEKSSVAIKIYYYLSRDENPGQAKIFLDAMAQLVNIPESKIEYFDLLCENGYLEDTIIRINKLIEQQTETGNRNEYRMLLARILHGENKINDSKKLCQAVLSEQPDLPKRKDFYYSGLANYIMDRKELAEYDFKRSLNYSIPYSELLNK